MRLGRNFHTEVKQHIQTRVNFVVAALRLGEVLPVPVEQVAGDEAGEKVVGPEGAARADEEHAHGDGEEEVALVVDPFPVQCQ